MHELKVKTETTGSATIIGAWELRAGSQSTTEWLDGAADVAYPGGGPGTFNASNSDGANGYDAAPKMALIELTQAGNSAVIVFESADLNGVHALFAQQTSGTGGTSDVVISAGSVADGDSEGDDGYQQNEVTITATSVGGTATAKLQVMMMYY